MSYLVKRNSSDSADSIACHLNALRENRHILSNILEITDNPPNGPSSQSVESGKTNAAVKDKPPAQSRTRTYMYQLGLVLLASTALVMAGSVIAFPSVIIADLLENNSTIFGTPMSFNSVQQDLLGSTTSMGALVGVWVCGLSMGPLGRLPVLAGLAVTGSISWVAIGLAPSPGPCLFFRGLGGLVYGGVCVTCVAYIVEITDDVVRSSLTLLASGAITFGQVISVTPAYWLRYYIVTFINCIYPTAVFFYAMVILPESPTVLVMKGRDKEARNVLQRLRGLDADVEAEIQAYKDMNLQHQNTNVLQGLRQPAVLKRLGIVCTLFVIQVFQGYTTFVAQTARIIQDSGGTVEASLATILVQSAQLLGICITMTFVKRLGRRSCLLLSHVVMAAAVGALALFTLFMTSEEGIWSIAKADNRTEYNETWHAHFNDNTSRTDGSHDLDLHDLLLMSTSWLHEHMEPNLASAKSLEEEAPVPESTLYGWVPLLCIMLAQLGSSFGVQNVPFILASEYFPTTIRPQAASICVSVGMLLGVASLQLYTPLQMFLTQSGLLFLHCGVSLLAIPFTYFCVQETVGKKVG